MGEPSLEELLRRKSETNQFSKEFQRVLPAWKVAKEGVGVLVRGKDREKMKTGAQPRSIRAM